MEKMLTHISSRTLVYALLITGIVLIGYTIGQVGALTGAVLACIPLVLFYILVVLEKPYWGVISIFTANYFIMGLVRYVPIQGGVAMDCLFALTSVALIIKSCVQPIAWKQLLNGLMLVSGIWLAYCILQLFNPHATSLVAWSTGFRSMALYSFLLIGLTFLLFNRYKDLKTMLYLWSVFTLLAVLKAFIQKSYGFDGKELEWLQNVGGTTHLLYYGARFFSFFTDASNFGTGMGCSMVVFTIAAFHLKGRGLRIYFIAVALVAAYGLAISGTRGALATPFAGFLLYLLLSGKMRVLIGGGCLLLTALFVLNFTHLGDSNIYIRRMRSAFNMQDASLLTRLNNQEKLKEFMANKPFGTGIGLGGGKAKKFTPDASIAQIPTDSWYVVIWVETGVVGLIVYLAGLVYVIARGIWIIFKIKNRELRGILSALLCGIFGVMISAYGNEVFGQFPNGLIIYMSEAFIFMGLAIDKELALKE